MQMDSLRRPAIAVVGIAVVALMAACGRIAPDERKPTAPPEDFIRAALDTTVDPGVDFFAYAEGGWLARHPIPASEASWGIGKEIQNELYAKLRGINEQRRGAAGAGGERRAEDR